MHKADFLISISLKIKAALVATWLAETPLVTRVQGKFHRVPLGLKEVMNNYLMLQLAHSKYSINAYRI